MERYPGYVTGRPRKHPPKFPKHYPVRKYLGKYEAWLLTLYGSGALDYADRHLEAFFAYFPKTWGLEKYTSADVEDYVEHLRESGKSGGVINLRLTAVRRFWRWLIEDRGYPMFNVVSASRAQGKKQIAPISEGDATLSNCKVCPLCKRRFRKRKKVGV